MKGGSEEQADGSAASSERLTRTRFAAIPRAREGETDRLAELGDWNSALRFSLLFSGLDFFKARVLDFQLCLHGFNLCFLGSDFGGQPFLSRRVVSRPARTQARPYLSLLASVLGWIELISDVQRPADPVWRRALGIFPDGDVATDAPRVVPCIYAETKAREDSSRIRDYIAAMRKHGGKAPEWIEWAPGVAARLDPVNKLN